MNRRSTSLCAGRVFLCLGLLACLCAAQSAQAQKSRRSYTARAEICDGEAPGTRSARMNFTGDYTGTLSYPERGINGRATLSVVGDASTRQTFTITPESGGPPLTGRLTAVTTCGYTAVVLTFGDLTPPVMQPGTQPPPPPLIIPLRACDEKRRGIALRARTAGVFDFTRLTGAQPTPETTPETPPEWGLCNRGGRLRGTR